MKSNTQELARYILKTRLHDLEALQVGNYWDLHDRILDALEQAVMTGYVHAIQDQAPVYGEGHLD